jgi:hypothetical protein
MRSLRSLIVIASLVLANNACGPGNAPVGQAPMVTMTAETLATLRQHFNESAASPRVVLLLSPT